MSNQPGTPQLSSTQPSSLRAFDYAQVDVFAEHALEGNQLAIFSDARGLSSEEMQALARETNLSETTFILPRAPEVERQRGVQVRIFTTQEELQFAGHPTLGTASWLYCNHSALGGSEQITLELPVGPIPVRFSAPTQGAQGVFGTMKQNDPIFGEIHNRTAVANALGLTIDDLDPDLPVQTVSTGMAFCIVPLRSLQVAARLAIPQNTARAYLQHSDAKFFHCITRADAASGADWHARMQFYNGEDPATGSASGCAIAYLVRHGLAASVQPIVIEQGIEMLRPSRIHVSAAIAGDSVSQVFVGGPHHSRCNGTPFPAVMHQISTGLPCQSPTSTQVCKQRWMRKRKYLLSSLQLRPCVGRQTFLLLASVTDGFACNVRGCW